MQSGGGFKLKVGGRLIALSLENDEAAVTAGCEKAFNGGSLFAVSLVRAALIAGREAHFHLGVDAAGMARIGIEIVRAAAQQKQLESFVGKSFCRCPRLERAV